MRSNPPPTLETADCEKLLDILRHNTDTSNKSRKAIRNYCMALLMLDAGLRVGELVSLRLSDLYFNSEPVRTIFIKPHMTKNKVAHSIPVSQRLAEALTSYGNIWKLLDPKLGGDFAFANTTTKHSLTTRMVEKFICAAGWKALGRPVHPHVLRHTIATRLMRVTNTSTVQQILGHKYLSSTQVYFHPNEEDKRQAIESASHPLENHQTEKPVKQDQPQPDEHQAPKPLPASPLKSQPASHW